MIVRRNKTFFSTITRKFLNLPADAFCDITVNIYERHIAVFKHRKHRGELQEILVAKYFLHSKSLPAAGIQNTFH